MPIKDKTCKELMEFDQLKETKFHGKPVKILPHKYSIIEKINEKISMEVKRFFVSNLYNNKIDNP